MRIPFFKRNVGLSKDPVCDMDVVTNKTPGGTWKYKNTSYYFCGPGCNRAFQKAPLAYLSGNNILRM